MVLPSQKKAYRSYYERNREEICERMRQKSAEAREAQKKAIEQNPEEREKLREYWRDRAKVAREKKIHTKIGEWMSDDSNSLVFRTFLRELVTTERYKELTLYGLESLRIASYRPQNSATQE